MNRTFYILIILLLKVSIAIQSQEQKTLNVFEKNKDGYNCYRIPAIIQSKSGTLLAFAEARKHSCSDTGDIDLVLKRSEDGGKTWGNLIVVANDKDNVCGNPVPIVDQKTGQIILVSCWNLGEDKESQIIDQISKEGRRVFVQYSDDDGKTWSDAKEITKDVKLSDWTWYATGPCHGIQLQNKKYKGRLVVPANHIVANTKTYHSHVIYSDDKGKTWQLGGVVTEHGGNESTVVELKNGDLMLNMRNYNRDKSKTRSFVISSDGGETWSDVQYAPELIETVCQGSILNYTNKGKISEKLLFSNASSVDTRTNMTIKLSENSGKCWTRSLPIYPEHSAYSDLVALKNGQIGLLYEYGENNPYEQIGFTIISIDHLK